MTPSVYRAMLRVAQRCSRRADEADDLLQDALLEAVRAGRTDLSSLEARRWLAGVIRNRAAASARAAGRRRRRETNWQIARPEADEASEARPVAEILKDLPPSLKVVAALALSGHNRREIAYLLELPDTALRQRVSALKRHLRARGIEMPAGIPGLSLELSYGRIREALLPALIRQGGMFASHDPDGHTFIVRRAHI
jgi:DNA-directed RNA polymerase specialized sigma24 family protein